MRSNSLAIIRCTLLQVDILLRTWAVSQFIFSVVCDVHGRVRWPASRLFCPFDLLFIHTNITNQHCYVTAFFPAENNRLIADNARLVEEKRLLTEEKHRLHIENCTFRGKVEEEDR
jgi:hypothetical protein